MGSPENPNWLLDCALIDDIPVSGGDLVAGGDFVADGNAGLCCQGQGYSGSYAPSAEVNGVVDVNGVAESGSRKRSKQESCSVPGSKACREKMRRDRLNDKFMELGTVLEPGKPPKMEKAAILSDAARMVIQLRSEAQKLKDSNDSLQEKIKELKSEKNELRDEKQRLKAEKEGLEQQIKAVSMTPSFIPHPPVMPNPFMAPPQAAGGKLIMPYIGYPGFTYQVQAPANVDDKNELPPAA